MYYRSNEQSNVHPLNYYTVSLSLISRPLECFHLPQLLNMTSHPPFLLKIHLLPVSRSLTSLYVESRGWYLSFRDWFVELNLPSRFICVVMCVSFENWTSPPTMCAHHTLFIHRLPVGTWVASLCDSWRSCHYEQVYKYLFVSMFSTLLFLKKN